jgi:hypothetical protein
MKVATVELTSVTPYSASRMHDTPKLEKERADEYEGRTWREKAYYDESGVAYIPSIAFKQSIDAAAKYLSLQVPGKGKATYTKNFASGVLCSDNMPLGLTRDNVTGVTINAHADGRRGSGKRVKRTMPVFPKWSGKLTFYIFDDAIPKDIFEYVIKESGKFIGVGQYRPQNGGLNGRWEVKSVQWTEQ